MKDGKVKPAVLFTIVTCLVMLCGVLTRKQSFDIQLHDTYYVIGYAGIFMVLGVLTGLSAVICYLMERFKS